MGLAFVMIFATPDFGASAGLGCFLLVVWAFVLVLAMLGVAKGVRLLHPGSPWGRRYGVLLLLASGLVPLSCCVGPSQLADAARVAYRAYGLPRGAWVRSPGRRCGRPACKRCCATASAR
jgi:hypothetical protein